MAHSALPAPRPAIRRRAFFGLFDADGWAWAGVKSVFWFVVIVTMLGYIPDRAYYFTVGNTVDIWPLAPFLQWSPVNLCPPENETLPCPAPTGATLPWHLAPTELQLPAGRTDGAAAVIGQTYIYAGGSDGQNIQSSVYISHAVGQGSFDKWSEGPALPEARSQAASVVLGNTLYVIGGYGPDGKPTTTTYSLTVANDGTVGDWTVDDKLALPAPRAGSTAVEVSDGIVVMGGTDGTAATRTVWKAQQDTATPPVLGAWVAQPGALVEANTGGTAVHVGDVIYLIGGVNAQGAVVSTVQLGLVGSGPSATAKDPNVVDTWKDSAQTNLPGPRTQAASFTSNGSIYVVGGSDGTNPIPDVRWATPDANGTIPAWNHLSQMDVGEGIQGSQGVTSGAYAFIIGGQTARGVTTDSARAYLAPALPFFELGVLGATIPALKLSGEIGQQIGYLNAAGVGTANFVILLLIGWGFAHKEQIRSFIVRRRR
jgi:Kelch motif